MLPLLYLVLFILILVILHIWGTKVQKLFVLSEKNEKKMRYQFTFSLTSSIFVIASLSILNSKSPIFIVSLTFGNDL